MLSSISSRRIGAQLLSQNFRALSGVVVPNPYTGETYCEVAHISSADASRIVDKAASAQALWKKTTVEERIAVCQRFLDIVQRDADRITRDVTGQMGKPQKQSHGELSTLVHRSETMMGYAAAELADEVLPAADGLFRKIAKEPVGLVLVIAPWNYPLICAGNTVVPAVLAGNGVLIKHSSITPLCANVFEDAFAEAGAPEGLVAALHAPHGVVSEVIERPEVGFVSFTGSVSAGRKVYQSTAAAGASADPLSRHKQGFINATLELGGKDPAYVAEDANATDAAEGLVDGAFYNAGQSCCGIERVYVHESKYDEFLLAATAAVERYSLGDPLVEGTTLGPLAQPEAVEFLEGQVTDAVTKGARLLTGGRRTVDADGKGTGRFFAPALLADCNHSMSIMVEESFGPVLGVARVSGEEEALQLMNDSPYGLTAAVFTKDQARAERMAGELQAGTVFMNRCDYLDPELAWTGVKDTGKGVSLSRHGFGGVTRMKSYNFRP